MAVLFITQEMTSLLWLVYWSFQYL